MYKYIVSAIVIRDETKSFSFVEPFYCTFIHQRYLLFYFIF
jgi:hypothetical protein